MNEFIKKLSIVAQAQTALLRGSLRQAARGAVFVAVALVFVLSAIAILNLSLLKALSDHFGPLYAGLIVSGGDIALAGILLKIGLQDPKETEQERLAKQLMDLGLSSMSEDLDRVRVELTGFLGDVRRIRSAISTITSLFSSPLVFLTRALRQFLDPDPAATTSSDPGDDLGDAD
jgi:hypothetical protein